MATARISIGSINVTGHLLGILRSTSDLANIVAQQDLFPSNNGNFVFSNIPPDEYRLEIRESTDGLSIGTLIGPFYTIDVRSDELQLTYRMYFTDGIAVGDPANGTADIIDPYLDGKNIVGVFKEGFRFLHPTTEYTLLAGGGIHLEQGATFNTGEVIQIQIATTVSATPTTAGLFAGTDAITEDTTLDASYQNKKIKCNGAGNQLTITLPQLATLPEGKFLYFTTYSGNQYQTRFVTQNGEQIEGYGTEIVLGKKEFLWIEKRSALWEVVDVHENVDKVGRPISVEYVDINMMPADDRLLDGNDYPRIWKFITTKLPAQQKLMTTDAAIAAQARTAGFECLFMVASDSKRFRMPDKRKWTERGMASFTSFGDGDPTRLYNYPGGTQLWKVGQHYHRVGTQNVENEILFNRGTGVQLHPVRSWNVAPKVDGNSAATTDMNKIVGTQIDEPENIVNNFGVIYAVLI